MFKIIRIDFSPTGDFPVDVATVTYVDDVQIARQIVSLLSVNCANDSFCFRYVKTDVPKL